MSLHIDKDGMAGVHGYAAVDKCQAKGEVYRNVKANSSKYENWG